MPQGILRKHGIEALRIKVEKVDVVARSLQSVERLGPDRRVKTLGRRMTIDIKDRILSALSANSDHASRADLARQRRTTRLPD
jgi:hypothetical protein